MEPMIEYQCKCQRHPLNYCDCYLCQHVDELVCSRGRHCVFTDPKPLGYTLGEDDNGHPTGGFTYAWHLQSMPEFPFCEDCASVIEQELPDFDKWDPTETGVVLEGDDGTLYWSISVSTEKDPGGAGRFQALITDRTPDGGHNFELESPQSWHTLKAAVVWATTEVDRQCQNQLDWEAQHTNREVAS